MPVLYLSQATFDTYACILTFLTISNLPQEQSFLDFDGHMVISVHQEFGSENSQRWVSTKRSDHRVESYSQNGSWQKSPDQFCGFLQKMKSGL